MQEQLPYIYSCGVMIRYIRARNWCHLDDGISTLVAISDNLRSAPIEI